MMSSFKNWIKKTKVCISCTTECKILKSGKIRNIVINTGNLLLIFLSLLVLNVQIEILFDPILG